MIDRKTYGFFDEERFRKAQALNDDLMKKKQEREANREIIAELKEEFKRHEFKLYQMVSQEVMPGRQGKKYLKFTKEVERKAEVQFRISGDINASNLQDRLEKLESRDRLFAIAIDWLEKEFSLQRGYLEWIIQTQKFSDTRSNE